MVNIGVHSCSPVAPHRSVCILDGSVVTSGPAAECKDEIRRLPENHKQTLETIRFDLLICTYFL